MAMSRDDVRQLVAELPEGDLEQASLFLRWIMDGRQDAVLLALAHAPIDADELDDDERTALEGAPSSGFLTHEEAQEAAHEAAKRRLGIS